MSKEIAQTVGGKKIAWLIAIVAAFAVLATISSQWRKSEAAELAPPPDTAVVTVTDLVAPVPISIDHFVADRLALNQPDIVTNGHAVGVVVLDSTVTKAPGNPWDAHSAVISSTKTFGSAAQFFAALAPPGCSVNACSEGAANRNIIPVVSGSTNGDQGVSSAAKPDDRPVSAITAQSSTTDTGSDSATWLYAVLGLGALAFGVGGIIVARRSR